jgi:outer membrane lipoprotein-sorting protein
MAKRIGFRLVILLAVVLIFSGLVLAATPEFSGEMILTDAKGKVTQGKIYVQGTEKIRQETSAGDEVSVTILRLDKKVSWTLLPDQQYMEVNLPFDPNQPNLDLEYEMKTLGSETVNGYPCQIIQYTYKDRKYGVLVQWFSEELGFAVKTQTKDGKGKVTSTVEYRNIVEGKQPDELFEIPSGYSKFSIIPKLPFSF